MISDALLPPEPDEYAPAYAPSVTIVVSENVLLLMEEQRAAIAALGSLSEDQAGFRYAAGKWSIKEVITHLNDTERIFAYRTLRFARGDETPLPGFDHNLYVTAANVDQRPIGAITKEFEAVRTATLALVHSLEPEALLRRGVASNAEVTVRALIYLMAGHVAHHLKVLQDYYGVDPKQNKPPAS